jgi:hypothetical protein
MSRARRLMRLHDGLINTRQRSIRSDWGRKFCQLMRWKMDSDIERVDSADAVIVLRSGCDLKVDDFAQDSMDDMLRAAHVFAISALDRYVHERVCKGIITAYRRRELSREQKDFSIPLKLAMDTADSLRKAAKQNKQTRPANEFRNTVQEMLHRRPFQSWRDIEYAFCLIGVKGIAGRIQESKGIASIDSYRAQLAKIVDRRHRIVHEGDLPRHQRGGQATKAAITPKYVKDAIEFIEDFVSELEKV